jgi:hypothetical protein
VLADVIHEVFARDDELERGPEILAALQRCLDVMPACGFNMSTAAPPRIRTHRAPRAACGRAPFSLLIQ